MNDHRASFRERHALRQMILAQKNEEYRALMGDLHEHIRGGYTVFQACILLIGGEFTAAFAISNPFLSSLIFLVVIPMTMLFLVIVWSAFGLMVAYGIRWIRFQIEEPVQALLGDAYATWLAEVNYGVNVGKGDAFVMGWAGSVFGRVRPGVSAFWTGAAAAAVFILVLEMLGWWRMLDPKWADVAPSLLFEVLTLRLDAVKIVLIVAPFMLLGLGVLLSWAMGSKRRAIVMPAPKRAVAKAI